MEAMPDQAETTHNVGRLKYVAHRVINEEITIHFRDEDDNLYQLVVPESAVVAVHFGARVGR